MRDIIYLDYASSTPLDPRVLSQMVACLKLENSFYGNASSSHSYGLMASDLIEESRIKVASLIGAEPSEIIWTSGATESNNFAIRGSAYANVARGKHIITSLAEHKSVLEPIEFLEKNGFEVTYLRPSPDGLVESQEILKHIRKDTILISIMHVNNETGVIQNINSIAKIAEEKGILFHVDAAQSAGKIELNLKETVVDFLSLSAHKIYGPKGIGALFIRKKVRHKILPLIYGGGQEDGLRGGTLPTHQIVGMGEAFSIANDEYLNESVRLIEIKKFFLDGLQKIHKLSVCINGALDHAVPNIVNVSFMGYENDVMLAALRKLLISKGSACTSLESEVSHVLKAMSLPSEQINSALRFSFGRFTTSLDIQNALAEIKKVLSML